MQLRQWGALLLEKLQKVLIAIMLRRAHFVGLTSVPDSNSSFHLFIYFSSIFLFIFHCFLSISQWKLLLRELVWLRNGLIEHQEQYTPHKVNLNSYDDLPKKNKSLSETTRDLTLDLSFASFALRISWGPRAEWVLLCSAPAALRSSELAEEPASVRVFMLPKQTQITGVNSLPWLIFYLQTMERVVFLNYLFIYFCLRQFRGVSGFPWFTLCVYIHRKSHEMALLIPPLRHCHARWNQAMLATCGTSARRCRRALAQAAQLSC